MNGLKASICRTLNRHLRHDLDKAEQSHFCDSEYSPAEQEALVAMCRMIAADGYESVESALADDDFRQTLVVGSEYGVFVSDELSPAHLGIFIVAQMFVASWASSFSRTMTRSKLYKRATWMCPQSAQLAKALMFLAAFVPKLEKRRISELIDDLRHLDVSEIDFPHILPMMVNDNE